MKQSIFDALTQLIEIAWRQRRLILVPLLLAVPVGFAAGHLLPQTYAARALLALQEGGSSSPLAPADTPPEHDIKDRAPGLEALIKSDRVLVSALRDVLGDNMPSDPRKTAQVTSDLASHITFEMIGNNFLAVSLSGPVPHGLGRQLEAITSRFLETLVSPDQDTLSATQLVLARHREKVDAAEKALLRYKSQLGERTIAAIAAAEGQLDSRRTRLDTATADLNTLEIEIGKIRTALGVGAAPQDAGRRDAEIGAATAAAEAAEAKHTASAQIEARAARTRAQQLMALQTMEARAAAQRSEIEKAKAEIARMAVDDRSPAGELHRLEHERDEARSAFEAYSQRFPAVLSDRALQVLNAPERIRVIDAPKDPEFPTLSRTKIIVAISLIGVMLAMLLACVAELFDQHLRQPAEFEATAGVPVIARIPRARGAKPTDFGADRLACSSAMG